MEIPVSPHLHRAASGSILSPSEHLSFNLALILLVSNFRLWLVKPCFASCSSCSALGFSDRILASTLSWTTLRTKTCIKTGPNVTAREHYCRTTCFIMCIRRRIINKQCILNPEALMWVLVGMVPCAPHYRNWIMSTCAPSSIPNNNTVSALSPCFLSVPFPYLWQSSPLWWIYK